MKHLLLFSLLFANLFAVITIAPVEIATKSGYSGKLNGSLETKRGNSDLDNYSAGLRLRYDEADKYTLWSDFIFSYGQASGVTNTNKTYTHIRYIHSIEKIKPLNYELFVQAETNDFTNVKQRVLLGGDMRYHNNMQEYGNLFFGLGGFAESVKYLTTVDEEEKNLRINSYISYSKKFNKKSKLSYVLYYQPNVAQFDDYIFSNGLELTILIYEKLYINFNIYYDIDSKPAVGVDDTDFSQKTSFIYKF